MPYQFQRGKMINVKETCKVDSGDQHSAGESWLDPIVFTQKIRREMEGKNLRFRVEQSGRNIYYIRKL